MTVLEGILLVMVLGFVFYYFTSFAEIKKEPIKKITISLSIIKRVGVIIVLGVILLTIIWIPLTGIVNNSANKSYLGSLIGSFVAVVGAISAVLITAKLNKRHEEQKEYPKKYAKLQKLIMNSRKYFVSLETIVFNKEILNDPDRYMFKKFNEFISYYNETLDDLTKVDFKASLKFIDLYRDELNLASSILNIYKESDSISMYSNVAAFYEMFQTNEAKEVIKTGRKIEEKDPDDTPYRIIDGNILRQLFLPTVEKKLSTFIQELVYMDKELRDRF